MKLALEFPVDATIHIGSMIRMCKHDKEYTLIPDEKGELKAIRILIGVEDSSEVFAEFSSGGKGVQATLTINTGRVHDELIAEFQELESLLSFSTEGALRRVIWNKPKQEFIPETDEESTRVQVTRFELESDYPRNWVNLNQSQFEQLIDTKMKYSSLIVLKSFYREGLIEYEEFRYVNAFHNFYYVLEDLYGGGKTRTKAIIKELKAAIKFREIVQWALNETLTAPKHFSALQALLDAENLHRDIDGLIELLVCTRNKTHHYTSKGGNRYPTPFRHKDYHCMAWITLGMAVLAIMYRIVDINKSQDK